MMTDDGQPFAPEIKAEFDRNGYVPMRGFLSADEIAEVRERVARFIRDTVPSLPREYVFYEDKSRPETLKQVQALHANDSLFEEMMFRSRFTRLAEYLLDGPVVGKNMQYFNKPPGVGKPTPAHQDGYYYKLEPCETTTMWLPLEEVDEENGCVRYVRGSSRCGMRPHGRTETLGFSQGITDYGTPEDLADEIAVPAKPGDMLVHHALTIHRADGNRSATRTRQALGLVYYAERAKEDTATAQAYVTQLRADLAAEGKI